MSDWCVVCWLMNIVGAIKEVYEHLTSGVRPSSSQTQKYWLRIIVVMEFSDLFPLGCGWI